MGTDTSVLSIDDSDLLAQLEGLGPCELDELTFGVVRMDAEHRVVSYNLTESQLSGLSPERVIGSHFFTQVAPCMNNFMVAERFSEPRLDVWVNYVFTFRVRPTPVRLRLLKGRDGDCFVCVEKQ